MSEIAEDAFFWVHFLIFSWGSTIKNTLKGGDTHHTYSCHYQFADRKCQITKSQAIEIKYYSHPAVFP